MIKTDSNAAPQEVKATNVKSAQDVAKRAVSELSYALAALQRAGALFEAIEKAAANGADGLGSAFLLAQAGAEASGYQADRAEYECEFFSEVARG